MKLDQVAQALRTAGEVARAGENLVDSLAGSRRRLWPLLFAVGVGIGIGALVFDEKTRARAKTWLFGKPIRVETPPAPPPEARPS
jgi:hypothetical protein